MLRAVAAGSEPICVDCSYSYLFLFIEVSYHGTPTYVGVGDRETGTRLEICVEGLTVPQRDTEGSLGL